MHMEWRKAKNVAKTVVAALFIAVLVYILWFVGGGVSNREVRESVVREAASLKELVNARADAIDARLEAVAAGEVALDAKLTRVEEKLDALLKLAAPQLPDDMKKAE